MQRSPITLNLSGLLGHWNGAIDVLTSLLGPTAPNDPTNSCNLQWYDHDLNDDGNTGFGYDWLDLLPSYSAI